MLANLHECVEPSHVHTLDEDVGYLFTISYNFNIDSSGYYEGHASYPFVVLAVVTILVG